MRPRLQSAVREAMDSGLARTHFATEAQFRDELMRALCDRGLQVTREVAFKSDTLLRRRDSKIDLLIRDAEHRFAVELKYITTPPADIFAFFWHCIYDCVKIEYLMDHGDFDGGLVVGLTNEPKFWQGKVGGWARNYNLPESGLGILSGCLLTETRNLDNAIFVHRRYHLALSWRWRYEWLPEYGTDGGFRHLMLAPESRCGRLEGLDSDRTLPFLPDRLHKSLMARLAYLRTREAGGRSGKTVRRAIQDVERRLRNPEVD